MTADRKFVLFDFDGVIADSFAVASALAARQCVHHNEDEYRVSFEGNIYDGYRRHSSNEQLNHTVCEHDLDWWPEYEHLCKNVKAFDGAVEAVRQISASHTLLMVTSCVSRIVHPFLKRCEIENLFLEILDADVHTSKAKKIEMIFQKYGVKPEDCVFVTDTLGDIREASHHSMGSIACAWGFHPSKTLAKGEPFRILETPHELPQAVNDYFTR